jgi:CheY-like chemotaxis protein
VRRDGNVPSVLWVEDDPEFLELYLLKLHADGHWIETASNGEQGLRRALELRPDLLLTDIRMPGMSGLEMVEHLRENPVTASLPVIVLSNYDDPELRHRGLADLGVLEWLIKSSCTPGELSERVRFWTRQRREQPVREASGG